MDINKMDIKDIIVEGLLRAFDIKNKGPDKKAEELVYKLYSWEFNTFTNITNYNDLDQIEISDKVECIYTPSYIFERKVYLSIKELEKKGGLSQGIYIQANKLILEAERKDIIKKGEIYTVAAIKEVEFISPDKDDSLNLVLFSLEEIPEQVEFYHFKKYHLHQDVFTRPDKGKITDEEAEKLLNWIKNDLKGL